MASQEEQERPLTAEELREIEECNRIVEFHNLVVSGKHPTIKLTPQQLARHGGLPAPIEPIKVPEMPTQSSKDGQSELLKTAKRLEQLSATTLSSKSKALKDSERLGQLSVGKPRSAPKAESFKTPERLGSRSIPTRKDVVKMLQPSQASTPPPVDFASHKGPPASQSNTSRLNYKRDYYHDLGVPLKATKAEIYYAFHTLKPANPIQQDAYEILSDEYLRDIYDDARAFSFSITALDEVETVQKEPEPDKKELKIDFSADYYRMLGVDAKSTTHIGSIKRAFKHKMSVYDPNNAQRRRDGRVMSEDDHRKLDLVREAYAVLSNYELRKQYDSGRGIPKTYRPGGGKGRGKGKGKDRRRR